MIEEIALDVNATDMHGSILKRFCKPKSKKVSDAMMSNATTVANTTTMAAVTPNSTMMSDVLDGGHEGIPRCKNPYTRKYEKLLK